MKVRSVGIVGAGIMGVGIAHVCALAGIDVVLNDFDIGKLEQANRTLETKFARMLKKQKIDMRSAELAIKRLRYTSELEDLSASDFIIEAAAERFDIKQQILRHLDHISKPDAVIATNTSSVSIPRLASTLRNPGRLIGLHLSNPVAAMGLVEVIRGIQTDDATFQAAQGLVTDLEPYMDAAVCQVLNA